MLEEIVFQDVSYEIDNKIILKNISGTFFKGTITTIVGPSGSGKTTLLKMCNGLISSTKGNILINNLPIQKIEPTTLRRTVGICLQSAPIIRGTVYENLSLPRTLQKKKLSIEEANQLLRDVGLDTSFLQNKAEELSGGQRQKLSIARTLVNKPRILLLDEITSALDPVSAIEIEQLIQFINKKYEVTVIWITHNIEQAEKIGDYTWFLKDGMLVESGETFSIFHSSNEELQSFLKGEK